MTRKNVKLLTESIRMMEKMNKEYVPCKLNMVTGAISEHRRVIADFWKYKETHRDLQHLRLDTPDSLEEVQLQVMFVQGTNCFCWLERRRIIEEYVITANEDFRRCDVRFVETSSDSPQLDVIIGPILRKNGLVIIVRFVTADMKNLRYHYMETVAMFDGTQEKMEAQERFLIDEMRKGFNGVRKDMNKLQGTVDANTSSLVTLTSSVKENKTLLEKLTNSVSLLSNSVSLLTSSVNKIEEAVKVLPVVSEEFLKIEEREKLLKKQEDAMKRSQQRKGATNDENENRIIF